MQTGIFNTGNFTQDLAKPSFASMITRLMPAGTAPLFGLTSQLSTEIAAQTEHGFFTKTMVFPEFTINDAVGYAAGIGTFTVDSTADLLPGMILRIDRTNEHVIINTVASSTSITVSRGIGTVVAAAINDNDVAYQVGNAFEESSDRPVAGSVVPVRITNLTQIFRNTWALSGSAQATEVIAGSSPEAENRQDCAAFHAADMEKAFFFGQYSQGTRNGKPFRTMDGLINIIENANYYPPSYNGSTNSYTAGLTTNWTQLETMLDPVFDQSTDPKVANERVLFVGGKAMIVLNNIGRLNGTYHLVDDQTNYGLQFSTLTTARGKFRLVEHPLFNTNSSWASMAVAVDLSTFKLAYLKGRQTQNKEFNTSGNQANDNGIDAVGGTLTTEVTCTVKNPPANLVIRGLTAAQQG